MEESEYLLRDGVIYEKAGKTRIRKVFKTIISKGIMKNKNLVQVLGELGMSQREAEEKIRITRIKKSDKSNYQPEKSRKMYDILSPLYSR